MYRLYKASKNKCKYKVYKNIIPEPFDFKIPLNFGIKERPVNVVNNNQQKLREFYYKILLDWSRGNNKDFKKDPFTVKYIIERNKSLKSLMN